ncbi:hypothetical protein [Kocuria rhizophila]|uniref:hypothetical protein n=1 Tax=Kocuria rhizophila TaxID=72000 RepID=UPI0032AFDC8F
MILGNVPSQRLAFPRDLDLWRDWHEGAHPLRAAKTRAVSALRPGGSAGVPGPAGLRLTWRGTQPRILLAVDATTPTQIASVLRPLAHLGGEDVAILSTAEVQSVLPDIGGGTGPWEQRELPSGERRPEELDALRVVAATGHYLPAGALAHRWVEDTGAAFVVVQHGLLTPYAPPLPHGSCLLAFSEPDAEFYSWHRPDVTTRVIGSQLLWGASRPERRAPDSASLERPVFLGQLHGAELPRRDTARAAQEFCGATGAVYRPHPGEKDKLSRAQHAVWRARGMSVDTGGSSLAALDAPVASVFSTGVLEAAARGLPARVTHPDPPRWVEAFWERYGMVRWNGSASGAGAQSTSAPTTPPPAVPAEEPARAAARSLREHCGASLHQRTEGTTP